MDHGDRRCAAAFLGGLVMTLIATAVSAQTPKQESDWCLSPTATDDQTIVGCTALIKSGRSTPADLALYYDARASSYNHKGLYDQAIADETRAISLEPANATRNRANAHNNRGIAYFHTGLYDQAMADYNKAIEIDPDCAPAYNDRGNAYKSKGLNDLAIADYRAALRIDPKMQAARSSLQGLGVAP